MLRFSIIFLIFVIIKCQVKDLFDDTRDMSVVYGDGTDDGPTSIDAEIAEQEKEKIKRLKNKLLPLVLSRNPANYYSLSSGKNPIGQGGNAVVYKVSLKSHTDRVYAMKKIVLNRYRNYQHAIVETQLLKYLKDSRVVTLQDAFVYNDNFYLVMEHVEGWTIKQLESTQLGDHAKTLVHLFHEILLLVDKLHGLKVCHNDLNQSNIMLSKKGYLKLIDFGQSKAITTKSIESFPAESRYQWTNDCKDIPKLTELATLLSTRFPKAKSALKAIASLLNKKPLKRILEDNVFRSVRNLGHRIKLE